MLNKEQIENCIKIVDSYNNEELQSFVAIEELAELQQAISKYQREPTIFNIDNIAEEMADVYIVLEELKCLFSIYNDEIEKQIDYKLDRELKRIKCRELSKQ
ncbi:nucleoside triphosphate pyrophosphohydrolase family protein [Clostridium botulinum]|uniref:NTP pyrophosphohydrolase MazG putative catalytic core domain-containing protein n=3 Tax=Clostridium botulinum TaxID=1491 RepID=A0A6G4H491_CLOBO|nr:hypothetical protein [Clostridium botulinum]MBY6842233.1 hypothetical protein [Clostridium botulinum]MBY6844476.1 hypothetical protein [Clostridium botulinum]MBY6923970.1 hypothetical protein [Clostridium botulinum]MCR1165509.1 hypothetical protein [Clostridium botulinum]NFH35975.1 hypothetical protein [Clostridium botulinum]